MNIKKRYIYVIIGLLILVSGIFIINASVIKTKRWNSGEEIPISIDGDEKTLQDAIEDKNSMSLHPFVQPALILNPSHNLDEIWVSVDGDETTLQEALSTTRGLCGNSTVPYSSAPTALAYHFASEIEITIDYFSEMSLQEAIDDGEFCYSYEWKIGTCNKTCGGGKWDVLCNRNDGITDDDRYCLSTEPKPSENCNTHSCCTPLWYIGRWSGCSSCSGPKSRTVYCQCGGAAVADSNCPGSKPSPNGECSCRWSAGRVDCVPGSTSSCRLEWLQEGDCDDLGQTYSCRYYSCGGGKTRVWDVECRAS